jgi:hypothetical protein
MDNEIAQTLRFYKNSALLALLSFPALPGAADAPSRIDLPGPRSFPESITATSDGTIFAGNFAEGGILSIRNGKVEVWIKPGTFGTRSILGVFADERSGTLWACSNDYAKAGLTSVGDAGSVLKGFDLKTGAGKLSLPLPTGPRSVTTSRWAKTARFTSPTRALRVCCA